MVWSFVPEVLGVHQGEVGAVIKMIVEKTAPTPYDDIPYLDDARTSAVAALTEQWSDAAVSAVGDFELRNIDPQDIKQDIISNLETDSSKLGSSETEFNVVERMGEIRLGEAAADICDIYSEVSQDVLDTRKEDAKTRQWGDLLKRIKKLLADNTITAVIVGALGFLLSSVLKLKESMWKTDAAIKKVSDQVKKNTKNSTRPITGLGRLVADALETVAKTMRSLGKNIWVVLLILGVLLLWWGRKKK